MHNITAIGVDPATLTTQDCVLTSDCVLMQACTSGDGRNVPCSSSAPWSGASSNSMRPIYHASIKAAGKACLRGTTCALGRNIPLCTCAHEFEKRFNFGQFWSALAPVELHQRRGHPFHHKPAINESL